MRKQANNKEDDRISIPLHFEDMTTANHQEKTNYYMSEAAPNQQSVNNNFISFDFGAENLMMNDEDPGGNN